MGRSKENRLIAKRKGFRFTKKQLKKWNCKFHSLIFGKPSHDISIDDKSIDFKHNWEKKIKKNYL